MTRFLLAFVFFTGWTFSAGANELVQKTIYKLDKKRFEKYSAKGNSVYLPSLGLSFADSAKAMLCEPQLSTFAEKLKVMDAPLNDEDRKNLVSIQEMIDRCANGEFTASSSADKTDSGIRVNVAQPSPSDASAVAPGSAAKTPAVSVGKSWK